MTSSAFSMTLHLGPANRSGQLPASKEWLFDLGVNAELDLDAAADPEEN